MLLTITSTGKVTLLLVAGTFIVWALITAILVPRRNPDFPRNVSAFITVTAALFAAQIGAVYWVTSTQEVERAAAAESGGGETTAPAESTPADTTPADTGPAKTTPAGNDGDAAAGKKVFASAGCVSCHTLADAGATGSVGPNLDNAKPPFDLVVTRVTNGKGVMPPFKDQLTAQQIKDVAAYVSSVAGS